jgi:poly(A) polymerase
MLAEQNREFHAFLGKYGAFQTPDHHERVLHELRNLAHAVLMILSPKRARHESELRLFADGSFSMGICSAQADIDLVCIAPAFVSRKGFFNKFAEFLQNNDKCNSDTINIIANARIPILGFQFWGISIDLLVVRVNQSVAPRDLKFDDPLVLHQLADPRDTASIAGINAIIARNYILNEMSSDIDAFRDLFRFVRLWAKRRLIYGSSFGFLPGIACQLLSAFVVREHRQMLGYVLVHHFFELCAKIQWDKQILCLKDPPDMPARPRRKDVMILIVPDASSTNSLSSVTEETLAVMKREFDIGLEKSRTHQPWEKFIETPRLFEHCTRVLQVQFWVENGRTKGEFEKWKDFIVSRVPGMLKKLKNMERGNHPTPLPLKFATPGENGKQNCGCILIGLMGRSQINTFNTIRVKKKLIFAPQDQQNGRGSSAQAISMEQFREFERRYSDQLSPTL